MYAPSPDVDRASVLTDDIGCSRLCNPSSSHVPEVGPSSVTPVGRRRGGPLPAPRPAPTDDIGRHRPRLRRSPSPPSGGALSGDAEAKTAAAAAPPEGVPAKRYHGAKLMMEDSVFAELELSEAAQKVAGVRVRQQHVQPTQASLQTQAPVPSWRQVFADVPSSLSVSAAAAVDSI